MEILFTDETQSWLFGISFSAMICVIIYVFISLYSENENE